MILKFKPLNKFDPFRVGWFCRNIIHFLPWVAPMATEKFDPIRGLNGLLSLIWKNDHKIPVWHNTQTIRLFVHFDENAEQLGN